MESGPRGQGERYVVGEAAQVAPAAPARSGGPMPGVPTAPGTITTAAPLQPHPQEPQPPRPQGAAPQPAARASSGGACAGEGGAAAETDAAPPEHVVCTEVRMDEDGTVREHMETEFEIFDTNSDGV